MEDIRYPLGPFVYDDRDAPERRPRWIDAIARSPAELRRAVSGLGAAQLDTPYREGGWTLRQVVHHLADAHLVVYQRIRTALTEDRPAVKTFEENAWAELPDARTADVEPSLQLFEGVQTRLAALLRALADEDFRRVMVHPVQGELHLDRVVAHYDWHARHHIAQIAAFRRRMGW